MNFLKYTLVAVFCSAIAFGCDDFGDINENPNQPVSVPSSQLLADIVRVSQNQAYSTFLGGDMGSCWAQHWSKVQYNDEERYSPRQTVIEAAWDIFYADVISDARSMELLAAAEGNKTNMGIALTMQAYGLNFLTDIYGDIPNTEAIRAGDAILTPAYDAQSVVYDSIFAKLDRADALLAAGEGSVDASFDILYHGDASKWRKFANSLKFRALMRVSGKRAGVGAELTALLSRPMFTSNDDEAKLVYLSEQPNANPIYETIVFGNRGEFKVNSVLVDYLTTLQDPRLAVYAGTNDAGEYRGKPSGYQNVPNEDYNYQNVSPVGDFYLEAEAPAYLISYSELLFLHAEAAAKGFISGAPVDYYNAAITANMEANGITSGIADYLATGAVAYSETNIQLQKWIALYAQGIEAWTEWRRTGIPALSPAFEANPAVGAIPSRFSYPATEQTTNKANYDAAVAAQGADRLTTKVWWMN